MARRTKKKTAAGRDAGAGTAEGVPPILPGIQAIHQLFGDRDIPPPEQDGQSFEKVLISQIRPWKQARKFHGSDADDPELLELAHSIREKGIIEPIVVRPDPELLEGMAESLGGLGAVVYVIVAGERRYRGAALACIDPRVIDAHPGTRAPIYVPVIVREDLDEDSARELTVVENLHRKDLLPMEEAESVAFLLQRYRGDVEAVATKIGEKASWVQERCQIAANLHPGWVKRVSSEKYWSWSTGHIATIAKLSRPVQEDLLRDFNLKYSGPAYSVRQLREVVLRRTHILGRAPWDLEDPDLVPAAGPCVGCPYNNLTQPHLFAEEGDDHHGGDPRKARCTNSVCWNLKQSAHLERVKAESGAVHVIAGGMSRQELGPLKNHGYLDDWQYERSHKDAAGAVPAVEAGSGKVVYIKPSSSRSPGGSGGRKVKGEKVPMKDLEAAHLVRRQRLAIQYAVEMVEVSPVPSVEKLVQLAAVFGTVSSSKAGGFYDVERGCWKRVAQLDTDPSLQWKPVDYNKDSGVGSPRSGEKPRQLAPAEYLWRAQVFPVIASRIHRYHSGIQMSPLVNEAAELCKLIGIDWAVMLERAIAELPEPKSWAKRREEERQAAAEARAQKKAASGPRKPEKGKGGRKGAPQDEKAAAAAGQRAGKAKKAKPETAGRASRARQPRDMMVTAETGVSLVTEPFLDGEMEELEEYS